jgi:uncharacterized membrane protein YfcA
VFIEILVLSVAAGVLGALLGLGGGIIIVPGLTLLIGLPIRYAVGASIVSVIATSSGAAAAYVRGGIANLRIAIALEVATTVGALSGAFLAGHVSPRWLYVIFGLLLAYSAVALLGRLTVEVPGEVPPDPLAERLRFAGEYHDHALGQRVAYTATAVAGGGAMMYVAGLLSGLLGIGSGSFKVLAMDIVMRLPMKVSTATSNFMIGVTAAASAGIFLHRGYVVPGLAMPVMLGVLAGSMVGVTAAASAGVYFARGDIHPLVAAPVALGVLAGAWGGTHVMQRLRNTTIRKLFIPVLAVTAVEMVIRAFHV